MKRSLIAFIALIFFTVVLPRLTARGEIELLTAGQQTALDAELQRITDLYDFRVAIETIDAPRGTTSIESTADAIYAEKYTGEHGVMLLIATETRQWDISTHGMGQGYFFISAREYIADRILSDLTAGDLNDAYWLFAELCEDFLEQVAAGTPYTHDNLPSKPLSVPVTLIAIGAGLVIAYCIVDSMKKKLTSVAPKASATDYVRSGSLRVNKSQEVFLYRNVSKVVRTNSGGGRSGGSRSSGSHTSGRF